MAKTIQGTVTSDKTDKTIVVTVTSRKTHPIYKKQYSVNTKYMSHDEDNTAKVGDIVIIRETRPISRKKRFTLDKVVEKARIGFVEADATADVPEEEPKAKAEPKPKKVAKPVKDANTEEPKE